MALVSGNGFTVVRDLKVNNLNSEIKVLFNSYKDGSVVATVACEDFSFTKDIELETLEDRSLKKDFYITVSKLLKFNNIEFTDKLKTQLSTFIKKLFNYAKSFLGRPTNDYNSHDCQALLIIK